MDEDYDLQQKPVTVHKKPGRECVAIKKTVKKAVSKKETTAHEPDKSKHITTKEVKILSSKTDDTKKKTEMENKDKIKQSLQIEDAEDSQDVEKEDKSKFKCLQKAG